MRIIRHRLFVYVAIAALLFLFVPLLAHTPTVFLTMSGEDRTWFIGFVAVFAAVAGCFGMDLQRGLSEGMFRG